MATKTNQGFRQDLNLSEDINDIDALNNLGGAGIANDLRIIQNNLRNKDILTWTAAPNATGDNYDEATGVFKFPDVDLIFTNDDRVRVTDDTGNDLIYRGPDGNGAIVGVFTASIPYFVCKSDGETSFALSSRPSTDPLGLSIITGPILSYTTIKFTRDTPVNFENTLNFIEPDLLSGFRFLSGNLNDSFGSIQARNEFAKFDVTRKFKGNLDTVTTDIFKTEGAIVVDDPANSNSTAQSLADSRSPGVFIGDTRAFSSDNNPWSKDGSALATQSHLVSIGDLLIDGLSNDNISEAQLRNAGSTSTRNNIRMEGFTVYAQVVALQASEFTHKMPIVINGETYYMLLQSGANINDSV